VESVSYWDAGQGVGSLTGVPTGAPAVDAR